MNPVDVKVRRSSPPRGIGVLGFDAAGAMRGVGGDLPGLLVLHPQYELKARMTYRLHVLLRFE